MVYYVVVSFIAYENGLHALLGAPARLEHLRAGARLLRGGVGARLLLRLGRDRGRLRARRRLRDLVSNRASTVQLKVAII